MKRRLLIAAIFLLAGAVVNVAVAWGYAIWSDQVRFEPVMGSMTVPGEDRTVLRFDRVGITAFEAVTVHNRTMQRTVTGEITPDLLITSWSNLDDRSPELRTADLNETGRLFTVRHVVGSGWPVRALWAESKGIIYNDQRVLQTLESHGGYIDTGLDPWSGDFGRVLPLRPIWPGFVINTIFYAAVLWLLIPGLFVLRRMIRRKRGLCVKCGYPLGESTVCTECGKTLPKRAKVAT